MASVFTPNIQLENQARGDNVGTWDTALTNDYTLIDLILGGITTIGLNNSNVVLSAAQFKSKTITFNSTLAANVTITFPTSFVKSYEIQNVCTNSSFTITLNTTATGGQVICCPPGEIVDVLNDGANLKYRNLGRVGSYIDIAVTAVPAWISGCTVPPYLNCNGTTFSSATYPALATVLGSTTLPDSRGRVRAAMDGGANRIATVISSQVVGSAGGDQNMQSHTHSLGGSYLGQGDGATLASYAAGSFAFPWASAQGGGPGVTATAGSGAGQNVQPTFMAGLMLIRAA